MFYYEYGERPSVKHNEIQRKIYYQFHYNCITYKNRYTRIPLRSAPETCNNWVYRSQSTDAPDTSTTVQQRAFHKKHLKTQYFKTIIMNY